MRIVVTGGAGFIGSHVVDVLTAAGHEVWVVDNLVAGRLDQVAPAARCLVGDVLRPDEWGGEVAGVDVVIHLAAQVSVPYGEAHPQADGATNLLATIAMLQWAEKKGAKEFRFASSAAVYGVPTHLPLDENAPLAPLSFYGKHKEAAEWAVRHYCLTHGMAGVVLRLANVYGPRQRDEGEGAVVAAFAGRLAHGEPAIIHGDGGQSRDFVYVGDVADAFAARLGQLSVQGLTANIGTGRPTTILALWRSMARLAGAEPAAVRYGSARAGDIRDSVLSAERAKADLEFIPKTDIETGLRETLAYFRREFGR